MTLTLYQAAVMNAAAPFVRGPVLEISPDSFDAQWAVNGRGSLNLAQAALPLLLKGVEAGSKYPPTLIFTGATASVKASANFGCYSPPQWAKRALAQSLAREFYPQGVHVAHAIMDGLIDTPQTRKVMGDPAPDAAINPEGVSFASGLSRSVIVEC